MNTIIEPQKEIPVFAEADVIVVGGGPAGVGSALAAGRNGANTILIEQANCLGGLQTQCINPRFAAVDPNVVGGIILDIINGLKEGGAVVNIPEEQREIGPFLGPIYSFDPEYYKYMLDNMMEKARVRLLYHAFAVSVIKEGNTLKGVIIESKEGRHAVLGKVVIDATGSGDIIWKSGSPCIADGFTSGKEKGRHMGYSYALTIREVDDQKYKSFQKENPVEWGKVTGGYSLIKKLRAEGKLHGTRDAITIVSHMGQGTKFMMGPYLGLPSGHHSWTLDDISKGEIDLRKQAWSIYYMLKNNVGGFENSHLDQTPNHLFMRDAHRIKGDYVLTRDDISRGKDFEDSIAISNAIPDIFGPDQQHRMLVEVPPFDIPYRCLLSKEIDNLMAAGSTMSTDLVTYAAVRYCTPGVCTGQAAGTAAALAAKHNVTPKKLDIRLLQNTLREQGMHITVKDLPKSVHERYQKRIEGLKKKQLPIEPS